MKQRLMIASALACQPHILLADEPTTGLDVTVQAGILKLLKQLREERNISIILVSHDLGVIAETCDRVVVMKDGRVVEIGSTRQILLQPQADYTRILISAHPSRYLNIVEQLSLEKNPEPLTKPPVLQLENLSVTFGYTGRLANRLPDVLVKPPVQAVDNVTFDVKQGEAVGIVGESGSGKSTVARTIVRLITPTNGRVIYKGKDVHSMGSKDLLAYRRSIQMIFQDPFASLNPRMTVFETLAEPLRKHHICPDHEVDARIAALLESVELSISLKNRKPHEISGGQCQRVAIARALTLKPEIIIADEITSALDVTIQAQILELLEKLREEMNLTILMISHDFGVVKRICERILVMHDGRIVESGPANQVISQPTDPYTRELVAAVPRMPTQ
jgi:peptide/nickel transport system ATP-binding protein